MIFKPHEVEFLRNCALGRLATMQRDGTLQNSPVGFTYNNELETIDIAGFRMSRSQKYRNILYHSKVAFVVDDIASYDPWRVRCLEIRGTAEQAQIVNPRVPTDAAVDTAIIRVTPRRIISFGIDAPDTEAHDLEIDVRDV